MNAKSDGRAAPRKERGAPQWLMAAIGLALCGVAEAEPYIAAREGQPCNACHVNPTGGGMRSPFGEVYAQNLLPQVTLDMGSRGPWTGAVGEFLRLGGDLRWGYRDTRVPDARTTDAFATEDLRLYGSAELIPGRLGVYVDERLAPGGAINREAWGLLWFGEHRYYAKAGRLYLPYGLRLQDDHALVREASGVNYATPDNGVELGLDLAPWTAQLALSNGAGGGDETDRGKQAIVSTAFVRQRWRIGGSLLFNNAAAGDRTAAALYATLATGAVAWLAEVDGIVDDSYSTGTRRQYAALAEANWLVVRGHNLKAGAEYLDPDRDVGHDAQARYSAVWEASPIQFLQVRVGVRRYGGIPQNDLQNRREAFVELHVFL